MILNALVKIISETLRLSEYNIELKETTNNFSYKPIEQDKSISVATRLILGLIGGAYLQPTATRR